MNIEQLERELLAAVKVQGEDNDRARERAAVEALGSLIQRALEAHTPRATVVSIVARNLGVTSRRARELLEKYLIEPANPSPPLAITPASSDTEPHPAPDPPFQPQASHPQVTQDRGTAPLPAELMPTDGRLPAIPAEGAYRVEHRGGTKLYSMQGSTYSVLPGMDPTAPYGRYVDGRPMNEWGSPIGNGPPVMHGSNFIGEHP
jgi:hypothetical protein